MKRKRFTEELIIRALKQHESGVKVAELCRELGIVEQTFYRWKSKYGGMDIYEAERLRTLEEGNAKLKKMLENTAIKDALSKKW